MNFLKCVRVLATLAATVLAWNFAAAQNSEEYRSIVSLSVTHQAENAAMPWNKQSESTSLGNAVVVGTGQLLTTADLVKDSTLIEVRKFGRYPDYRAKPVLVDYELDLALLTVDDAEFWNGLVPMEFHTQPINYGRFVINRWRSNGRFEQGTGEVVDLRASSSRFGSMEIPVLRGNTNMGGLGWSEVMTVDSRLAGLVTSHNRSEVQATISPTIALFVAAANDLPYRGFAHRGFLWQRLNNTALREYYKLKEQPIGVLVNQLLSGGTGSGTLREGDILLKLGDYVIDPEGSIDHPLYGSMLFSIAINDTTQSNITAQVLRDGKVMALDLPRTRLEEADYRVPHYAFDQKIEYEVFGGLVLQELSLGYLQAWGSEWADRAPTRLVIEYALRSIRHGGSPEERVVIITTVLPDIANLGFEGVENSIVTHANGKPVTSLATFNKAIAQPQRGYHVLQMLPGSARKHLVFKASEIGLANRRIGKVYDVPAPSARNK